MSVLAGLSVVAMLLLMLYRRNRYRIPLFKTVFICVLLAFFGVLSTYLLFFIENGRWGGMSFFGAVLFVPILFCPLAKLFKIPVAVMLDFIAPPGLLMFAVMKANCALSGCCKGRVLWYTADLRPVLFPSPIVEAGTTVLLVLALLYLEQRGKTSQKLYPISLVAYGALRFVLNFFRAPAEPFLLGLQKGNFWALVAIISGLVWLLLIVYVRTDQEYQELMIEQANKEKEG